MLENLNVSSSTCIKVYVFYSLFSNNFTQENFTGQKALVTVSSPTSKFWKIRKVSVLEPGFRLLKICHFSQNASNANIELHQDFSHLDLQ